MRDVLCDENAWVCTDCLILHANGDAPPDWSEAEVQEWLSAIETELAGFRLTLGHGREQHDCATNFTVTPLRRLQGAIVEREEDALEKRAETATEALEDVEWQSRDDESVIGFRVLRHDLQTEGDRGNECDCEEISFQTTRTCDSCNRHCGGEWHAATIWMIVCEGAGLAFDMSGDEAKCPVCEKSEPHWKALDEAFYEKGKVPDHAIKEGQR